MKYPLMAEAGEGEGGGGVEGEGGGGVEGEGVQAPEFNILESAPEFARDWEEVKNAKSPEDLWQWMDNLRSFRGRAIALPGEDAGDEQRMEIATKLMERMPDLVMRPRNDEERAALFKQLGMPDEPGAYKVDSGAFKPDEERFNAIREAAHKANLTQEQFNAVFGPIAEMEAQAAQARQEAVSESMSGLKGEWGAAYEEKLSGVRDFMTRMGLPPSWVEAEKNGQFDATDYKALDDLAKRIGGEGAPGAGNGTPSGKLTPADAQAKIDEIRNNPDHPFNNPRADIGAHQRAVKQVTDLYSMLPGGGGQVETQQFGGEIEFR